MGWMDVNATLAEVPINFVALIDDTDFKSIEDALVYNQAGLALFWNFRTTSGAFTQTAVTPTTGGGDYDWTNQGNGIYTIGIPDTGGASINNDTNGFGWFTGVATGVLPWAGPKIGFRAVGLNSLLINSAYSVTRGLSGTALPAAVANAAGGLPISDAGGLDLDNDVLDQLVAIGLDHLVSSAAVGADVANNSIFAQLVSSTFGVADFDDYDNTTDSLHAIREHGDQAWLTGSGGGATASYTTTNWTRTVGDNDGGVPGDTLTVNGITYNIGEINSGTYIEVDAVFTITDGEIGVSVDVWGFYNGGGSHFISALALDTITASYEPLTGVIGLGTTVGKHTFQLSPGHTNTASDTISIKFLHGGGSGVVSHVFSVDKAQVNTQATVVQDGSSFTDIPWNPDWDGEVESECIDALVAYDGPTNAEMVARTLLAADYATAAALAIAQLDLDTITGAAGALLDPTATSAQLVNDFWDEILTKATHDIPKSAARLLRSLAGAVIRLDTAQGPGVGNNQIQLDAGAAAFSGAYDPALISIVDGTGAGQTRLILQYDGATKTATVDRGWKMNPDNTSEYVISGDPGREHVNEGLAQGGGASTVVLNALADDNDGTYIGSIIFVRSGTGQDQSRVIMEYNGTSKEAIVDDPWVVVPDTTSAYVILPSQLEHLVNLNRDWTAGGRLDLVLDDVLEDTADMQPKLGTPATNISVDIAAVKVDTGTNIPALIAALNDLSPEEVLAQVNAALDTAIPELAQGQPTATPNMRTGLMLLYMALRDKFRTQTSGIAALEIHNDAGTKIAKKLITDVGGDYTEDKMESGA